MQNWALFLRPPAVHISARLVARLRQYGLCNSWVSAPCRCSSYSRVDTSPALQQGQGPSQGLPQRRRLRRRQRRGAPPRAPLLARTLLPGALLARAGGARAPPPALRLAAAAPRLRQKARRFLMPPPLMPSPLNAHGTGLVVCVRTLPYAQALPVGQVLCPGCWKWFRKAGRSLLCRRRLHRISVTELFCRPSLCSVCLVMQGLHLGQPDLPRQRLLGRLSQKMLSAASRGNLVLPSALPLSARRRNFCMHEPES